MKLIDPCKQCIVRPCCRYMCDKADWYMYRKSIQKYSRGIWVGVSFGVLGILGAIVMFLIEIYKVKICL